MSERRDNLLREQVNAAWPRSDAPGFDESMAAAHKTYATKRRNLQRFAGVAAAAAIVAIAMFGNAPEPAAYIEVADLLESTYWSAPSDVLLPERQFDIYQDMPELFESTEPAGGTLL